LAPEADLSELGVEMRDRTAKWRVKLVTDGAELTGTIRWHG